MVKKEMKKSLLGARKFTDHVLISSEVSLGQMHTGVARSPVSVWGADCADTIRIGDGTRERKLQHLDHVFRRENLGRALERLAETAADFLARGSRVLNLGGDHSVAMGTLEGASRVFGSHLYVLWVDAHGDFNTLSSSPSGNMHGVPLAAVTGACSLASDPFWGWLRTPVIGGQVVHLGGRDFDSGEVERMRADGVRVYPMHSSQSGRLEIRKVVQGFLDEVTADPEAVIWLSFDIDAIDEDAVPGTGTPVGEGMSADEAREVIYLLSSCSRCVGMDLVEFNPDLDAADRRTFQLVKELLLIWKAETQEMCSRGEFGQKSA